MRERRSSCAEHAVRNPLSAATELFKHGARRFTVDMDGTGELMAD